MITKYKYVFLIVVFAVFGLNFVNAQEQEEESKKDNEKLYRQLEFFNLRGTNAVDMAVGASLITGDFPQPEADIYFKIGYKRFITEQIGISFTYNKYNLAFNDTFHQGFMSFDLNLEYLISPYTSISPFIYGGYGYNADNDFETTGAKVQGGLGIEFVPFEKVGIKLFGEYNYVMSNEANPIIMEESNISFFRAGIGVNLYFGGGKKKEKLLEEVDTVIKSNYIK
ncbi:Curli production assembly/transport component CsgG [Winogradskyella sp.]|uniref:Curli production assembly/transport component CsgG n=1 Tax=Winogradskyella sp. TaxID=1883156 RepID=UPI001AFF6336|nr:Curli production assembly/transport component CsgG [Winogradskyella sp.]MBO6880592.1 Curli production assembly/transport component CsgG [Winogradskyella sp.]